MPHVGHRPGVPVRRERIMAHEIEYERIREARNQILWAVFWDVKALPSKGPIRRHRLRRAMRMAKHMPKIDRLAEEWRRRTLGRLKGTAAGKEDA